MDDIEIRREEPTDFSAIAVVVEQAFESPVEAELVRLIRESPNYVPEMSLVAERDGVVGHVMLSYVELEDEPTTHRVLSLSPVSVLPSVQRRGIGSTLIKAALELADQQSQPLVCLEGDPRYYGRLGFTDARESEIYFHLPDWAPPNAGQIYKLTNYDPKVKGRLIYPPAFAAVEEFRSQLTQED